MIDALLRFVATSTPTAHWGIMVTSKLAASTLYKFSIMLQSLEVAFGHTGSQLNNLPFRRYDGVTLVKGCVSFDNVAAIENANRKERHLFDLGKTGVSHLKPEIVK